MSALSRNDYRIPDGEGYYVYEWLSTREQIEFEDEETSAARKSELWAIANDRRDFNRIRMCKVGEGQDC